MYTNQTQHHITSSGEVNNVYHLITMQLQYSAGNVMETTPIHGGPTWQPKVLTESTANTLKPDTRGHHQTSCVPASMDQSGPILSRACNDIVPAHSMNAQSDQHHLKTRLSPWALCPDHLAICKQFFAVCYQGVSLSWGGVLGLQMCLGRWCLSSGTTWMPWLQFLNRT